MLRRRRVKKSRAMGWRVASRQKILRDGLVGGIASKNPARDGLVGGIAPKIWCPGEDLNLQGIAPAST